MRILPINDEEVKMQGWKDIYVSSHSGKVHIFYYYAGKEAKNVMVLHTPVIAIKNCYECYEQLGRIYHFNVFALDYAPGEGECTGTCQDFTLSAMVENIDAAYEYIRGNYSYDIHLLGYTGAGGIIAQYYLGTGRSFKSFAQFACGIYGKTKPLGIPDFVAKPTLAICKLLVQINPNMFVNYKPPKSQGFHANLDDEFYQSITAREPGFFSLKVNSLLRILECMLGKESFLKVPIACPTLVFKTLHDRFFSKEYFDQYYCSLTCEKKIVEINDTHNSYFIHPDIFMKEVAIWFNTH